MNNQIKNIELNLTSKELKNDQISDSEDSALFDTIGDYITGCSDLEDIQNDPALAATGDLAREMISDYDKSFSGNSKNEKFINEIFSGNESAESISDEIRTIKQEITDKNLNPVASEWVREWQVKKQHGIETDPKAQEIRNFIKGATNFSEEEHTKAVNDGLKNRSERITFARYVSLSAAALIGVFFLIKTLLPTSDPEKLFNTFFKPFEAVSPVTRSINNNEPDRYSSAITSYKNGNYKGAMSGFERVLEQDPSSESARFLLGMSQLALQNYSQTIDQLTIVANRQGEYGKEARWYLGLSYLKTGNRAQAIDCFEYLVKADGFYRDRSENILRRLK
jgi:tetratricopeptide (TPR) repeat protein